MLNMNLSTIRNRSMPRRTRQCDPTNRVIRKPTAAAMGKQDCAWYRAARGGGVVEGLETRKMLCKSNPRQNAPCHVHDLQAWTAIRPHFSKPGIEPHALRSLQNDQHLRSDDPNSAAGICSTA